MQRSLDVLSSIAATLARGAQGMRSSRLGRRPAEALVLYEFESCPFCRKVREALTVLDLEAEMRPCPKGGGRFRPEVIARGGKALFPYLVDPNTGLEMYESDAIVRHLFATYGDGPPPGALLGPLRRAERRARVGACASGAARAPSPRARPACRSSCGPTRRRPTAASCARSSARSSCPTGSTTSVRGARVARLSSSARASSRCRIWWTRTPARRSSSRTRSWAIWSARTPRRRDSRDERAEAGDHGLGLGQRVLHDLAAGEDLLHGAGALAARHAVARRVHLGVGASERGQHVLARRDAPSAPGTS